MAGLGAQVVAIGQGTAEEAGRICGQMGVAFPCLGDPEKTSYRAYGLRRAGWREIVLDPMREGNAAMKAGYRAYGLRRAGWREIILDPMREGSEAMKKGYKVSIRGSLMRHADWFQLPGVAIVDRAGIVRWLHQARHSGDIPSPATVIAALPVTARGSL